MSYAELMLEDISVKQYQCLISQLALYNQVPIKVLRYFNDKSAMFIVIKQSANGTISSKKITMPLAEGIFFTQYLGQDFPDLEFESITLADLIKQNAEKTH